MVAHLSTPLRLRGGPLGAARLGLMGCGFEIRPGGEHLLAY